MAEFLTSVFWVQIERSSNEDAVICSECVSKINGFYKYRELCRTNDIKHQEWNRRLALAMGHTESTSIPLDDNEAFRFVETHDGTTSCMVGILNDQPNLVGCKDLVWNFDYLKLSLC